jgi:predicted lipoprotein with Yx(FWY)xxD motif
MMKALVVGLMGAAALSLVATSMALASSRSATRPAAVGIAHTGLGRVIVDVRGRALYLFEKDRHGHSACSGICASYWPPLLTHGKPTAVAGAKQSLLGTIRRADGSRQVTYAGHPLYLFAGDTKRNQTNGEGLRDFGAGWYVLAPSGQKIDSDG